MAVTIIGWVLALVAAYILFTQWTGATNIISTTGSSSAQVLKVLQGR